MSDLGNIRNLKIQEIELLAKNNWYDLVALSRILDELDRRTTDRAKRLENNIALRLEFLESKNATPTDEHPPLLPNIEPETHVPTTDQTPQPEQPNEISTIHTGDISTGLERVRTRLLDLSNRNRLLNFRHPTRSCLRVVDESPDQIYNDLINDATMVFEPVPEPSRKDLIRYYGKEYDDSKKPTAREWAEYLDISTAYDLSFETAKDDHKIQTLFYFEELEARLRTLSGNARTAIEESGSNMLFLAFGFLQWTESAPSSQKRFAPLLLLPVTLRKGKLNSSTGTFSYELAYSGEDILPNLSLQEKMIRDFGLVIPDLDENESPSTYLDKVYQVIYQKSNWDVTSWVTMAMFHFGKLLMFLDLNPEKWPQNKNIIHHDTLKDLFEGSSPPSQDRATEYDFDNNPALVKKTPLIYEADSSQHSALVDVIEGKNLVIEGPPGTGKSQTITNLIAAALSQGKTVLFISEKMAALEVVKRRLNNAGLGDFCLELHSHKTQKKAFLEDVEMRYKKKGTYRRHSELGSVINQLENLKEQLKDHAELIGQEFGRIDRNIHQIFSSAKYYALQLDREHRALLIVSEIKYAEQFNREDIETDEDCLTVFAKTYGLIVDNYETINDHPWYGVNNAELQPFDQTRVVRQAEQWRNSAQGLKDALIDLNIKTSAGIPITAKTAQDFVDGISTLSPAETDLLPSLDVFIDNEKRTSINALVASLQDMHKLTDQLSTVFKDYTHVNREDLSELIECLGLIPGSKNKPLTSSQLLQTKDLLIQIEQSIGKIATNFGEIREYWNGKIEANWDALKDISAIIDLCADAPTQFLSMRDPLFEDSELDEVLVSVKEKIDSLKRNQQGLSEKLNIQLSPSASELQIATHHLRQGGLLKYFKSDWRSANKLFGLLAKSPNSLPDTEKANLLDSLANYLIEKETFQNDTRAKRVLKHLFSNEETPIEDIYQLKSWYDAVGKTFGFGFGSRASIGNLLYTMPAQVIRGIGQLKADGFLSAIKDIDDALVQIHDILPILSLDLKQQDIQNLSDFIHPRIEALNTILRLWDHLGLADQTNTSRIPPAYQNIEKHEQLTRQIDDHPAGDLLGPHHTGITTRIDVIEKSEKLAREIANATLPSGLKTFLFKGSYASQTAMLNTFSETIAQKLGAYGEEERSFIDLVTLNIGDWLSDHEQPENLDSIIERIDEALASQDRLVEWIEYINAKNEAIDNDLAFLIDIVITDQIPASELINAYRYCFYHSLSREIFKSFPVLRKFRGLQMDQLRARFIKTDEEILNLQRQEIAHNIDQHPIPPGVRSGRVGDFTDLHLIENEINKKTRHIPIRQLIDRAGNALQALKPCFMMGPLSVAQYLKPGKLEFDLVVMDEASQMKPEDAIGAIARGKQVVVVGDPKQLPPTTFFDRLMDTDTDDDETTALEESESILDAATPLFKPVRQLRWHYRSRHQSLIAFSNDQFYDNELVVFPSPHFDKDKYGIQRVYVENGLFQSRVNVSEAQKIAQDVIQHMKQNKAESLGVVAMNSTQKDLIETEVENLLKNEPAAQRYVERHETQSEPFFVKNLENVQGDERDVIFISFTYGPLIEGGTVPQRFGPINQDLGWRRLNVLFTRAKSRIRIFTSMSSDDIRVDANSKRGVKALRDYLAYAETGRLNQPIESGREPDSDFERAVAQALKLHNYECVAQLGVAGFYIDIAVRHPDYPGRYLLGIECDGATYHSGKTVRDRDKLRQAILENMDWNIHRIWSTDWFRDPNAQIEKVIAILEAEKSKHKGIKQKSMESQPATTTPPAPVTGISLTREMAKLKLQTLAKRIDKEIPPQRNFNSFLCEEMIDALLEWRPFALEQFQIQIPLSIRSRVDPKQVGEYHDEVFDILGRIG